MFYYINQPRIIFIVLLIHIVAALGFIGPQKIMFTLDTKAPNPSVIYLIGHLAISQFEFLVITKKNIFTCRLFLSLNISDFNLLCDNCTPWKKSPPLSEQAPSKSWGLFKPPVFKIWLEAQPPPPAERGECAHYVTLLWLRLES